MVAGHEDREGVPLHLVSNLCDHQFAIAYQTPGDIYIDIPVIVNWVGDLCNGMWEEGAQMFDGVVTLCIQFHFYFRALVLNAIDLDYLKGVEKDQFEPSTAENTDKEKQFVGDWWRLLRGIALVTNLSSWSEELLSAVRIYT